MFAAFLGFVIGWCVRGLSGRVRREHHPRLTAGAWIANCCGNDSLPAPARQPDRPPPTGIPGPGVRTSR